MTGSNQNPSVPGPAAPDGSAGSLVECSIDGLMLALAGGGLTATELIARCLHRIAKYDWNGLCLNSVPLLNPAVFAEAAASDDRRAAGLAVRPLEGIPFTLKDNFGVSGMTAAAGSPAFVDLRPQHDAFLAAQLRAAGAILIGKTNMPPMARGGMQRGVYGRAESPYNSEYLTAAFGSGSSNGSATSTAASFAAFGLGTETVSSGRSPASNNALVAYTPSRGVISLQGVWPLYATCDVVTPHTRSLEDLFRILPVLTTPDPSTACDFWRKQEYVPLLLMAKTDERPAGKSRMSFAGKRIGVPKMYINRTDNTTDPVVAASILALWERAQADLEAMGATVVETEFPVVTNYEANHRFAGLPQGLVGCPSGWTQFEQEDLLALTWQQYLDWAADPHFTTLDTADPDQVFPFPLDYPPHRFDHIQHLPYQQLFRIPKTKTARQIFDGIDVHQGLSALEEQRRHNLEEWMDAQLFDLIVFPGNADVARSDMETNPASAEAGLQNGVRFSHGNRVLRHLGIPTVNVPMGRMADTHMPVNLTFVGKAYSDNILLEYAYAYEQHTRHREPPPLAPALPTDVFPLASTAALPKERVRLNVSSCEAIRRSGPEWSLHITGTTTTASAPTVPVEGVHIDIFINGDAVDSEYRPVSDSSGHWETTIDGLLSDRFGTTYHGHLHDMVVLLARSPTYRVSGELVILE